MDPFIEFCHHESSKIKTDCFPPTQNITTGLRNTNWRAPINISERKVHPKTDHEAPEGEHMYSSTPSLTLALYGGWVFKATFRPLYSREGNPVPVVHEAGWAPGPVWTGAENVAAKGIRSPDRPVDKHQCLQKRCDTELWTELWWKVNKSKSQKKCSCCKSDVIRSLHTTSSSVRSLHTLSYLSENHEVMQTGVLVAQGQQRDLALSFIRVSRSPADNLWHCCL